MLSIFLTVATLGHAAGNGLLGQYYSDTSFTNFAGEEIDPTVNFNWALASPGFGMDQTTFSVRWTGFVVAPCSDTYTFQTTTDDGVRLWVNGAEIINQWVDQSATAVNSSPVYLTAGAMVPIEMDYYQDYGDAVAILNWSSSTCTAAQVVPQSQLYSVLPATPTPTQSPTPIPSTACPSSDQFKSGSLNAFWSSFDVNPVFPSTITAATSLTMTTHSFGIQAGQVYGSNSTDDAFAYVVQSISGDFDVGLQVDRVPTTTNGQMGLMARNTTGSNSAHMYVGATQAGVFQQIYRLAVGDNGVSVSAGTFVTGTPQWVRLVRSGNNFSTYYSANAINWTQIGATQTIAMGAAVLVGPASSSYDPNNYGSGSASNFVVFNSACPTSCHVVISALTTHGRAGAADDLVQLYDPCGGCTNINNYTIRTLGSCTTAGSAVLLTITTNTVMSQGAYRLLANSAAYVPGNYGAGSQAQDWSINGAFLADTGQTVALCDASGNIVDMVGLGTSAAPCFEGVGQAPATGTRTIDHRSPYAFSDTNQNSTDFVNVAANGWTVNSG
ncbi:MAG TPA: PA14 domain-containing protein, partial [bacterium]|nr:PA14 domain-containing protein [bacterium]